MRLSYCSVLRWNQKRQDNVLEDSFKSVKFQIVFFLIPRWLARNRGTYSNPWSSKWWSDLVVWQQQFLLETPFVFPHPEACLSSRSLSFACSWLPSVFSFSFLLIITLIISTKTLTILSVKSSWRIFSVFSFISYCTVKVLPQALISHPFVAPVGSDMYTWSFFSRFISWSTVLVSKISKFFTCWSCKLRAVPEEAEVTCTSDMQLPRWQWFTRATTGPGLHGALPCVGVSLLEALLSLLFCVRTQPQSTSSAP